jgi:hypothetical protein
MRIDITRGFELINLGEEGKGEGGKARPIT